MAIEEIGEGLIRYALGFVLQRVFYWPGWLLLRLLTVGRYPPPGPAHNRPFVALFALAALIVVVGVFYSHPSS